SRQRGCSRWALWLSGRRGRFWDSGNVRYRIEQSEIYRRGDCAGPRSDDKFSLSADGLVAETFIERTALGRRPFDNRSDAKRGRIWLSWFGPRNYCPNKSGAFPAETSSRRSDGRLREANWVAFGRARCDLPEPHFGGPANRRQSQLLAGKKKRFPLVNRPFLWAHFLLRMAAKFGTDFSSKT